MAIGVVLHAGCVLVGRRTRPPLEGYSEFPGGKAHSEETPEEAVVREVLEETGLAVRVGSLLAHVRQTSPHGALDLYFFLCRLSRPDAQRVAAPEPTWIPLEDLPQLDFPAANREALARLRDLPQETLVD